MTRNFSIDLDAQRREAQVPDGIPLTQHGEQFLLPAELPLEVFGPFLTDEIDLPTLLREVFQGVKGDDIVDFAIDLLTKRPTLVGDLLGAVREAADRLFGAEPDSNVRQFDRFWATRPSIGDLTRLAQALWPIYGATLGEAWASLDSSDSEAATPLPTSSASTDSTSETPTEPAETPASSESAASST